jgi:hypothetical protein
MPVNPVRWIKDRRGHPLEAYWEIEVRDASGKLLTFRKVKAKSWLAQFIGMIRGQFACDASTPVIDIGGTTRYYQLPTNIYDSLSNSGMYINSGAGDSSFGLVVGSSDTPNTVNQYTMGAIIPHGTGSGQLSYGTHTIENPSNPTGTNYWFFRIIRTFTNNSGASITVKEIGLIVRAKDSSNNLRYFLIARDVISPVTVPNGATLTVRYIPKITVS